MKTIEIEKRKIKTQDDLIKYLLTSKEEAIEESKRFAETSRFKEIQKKLDELNKTK